MKNLLLFFSLLAFLSCKDEEKKEMDIDATTQEEMIEEAILLGPVEGNQLMEAPYLEWYNASLEEYDVSDDLLIMLHDTMLKQDIQFKVFFGSWCEDSQREVPRFLSIMNRLKVDETKYQLIAVDENKTEPAALLKDCALEYVPTIIVMVDGHEKGRFVESARASLAQDLYKIITTNQYKHSYED